ncbi:hypothetical protein B0H11DRAFT_2275722 [Mycena galericulata]|nr:hypothetical protein B0H11DRAFT_2275722 [Mycena galericulata]
MDVDAEPNVPQRIPELWFDDGNIVIQAGNNQFRVYRGILAARSSVFQDMFSFPQPADSELVDGCPLVRLPDLASDVTMFLRAIFDSSFFKPFPAPTTFETIKGCLRLGHKYEVDYLHRRALIHLSSTYDTTLSGWDNLLITSGNPDIPEVAAMSWMRPDLPTFKILEIQLIREMGALWLLPGTFYCLSVWLDEIRSDILQGGVYKDEPTRFSVEDQDACFRGHAIQTQSVTTDILRFLSHPLNIQGCTTSGTCYRGRLAAIEGIREMVLQNPTTALNIWGKRDWETLEGVCPTCLTALKTTHQTARQAFWNKLPEIYGLPPWNELEEMKVAAIGTDWFA